MRKVLLLERRQGFKNRSMLGGLSAFSRTLHSEAGPSSLAPEVALTLECYDLQDQDARRQAIERALDLLDSAKDPGTAQHHPIPLGLTIGSAPTRRQVDARPSEHDNASLETPLLRIRSTTERPRKKTASTEKAALGSPVTAFPGVGPKLGETLNRVNVRTIRDLLFYLPREHVDYRRRDGIGRLRYGERTTIVGIVQSVHTRRMRQNLSVTTAVVADDSGQVAVRWFNQRYLEKTLQTGRRVAISGVPDLFDGHLVFSPRDYEFIEDSDLIHAGRLVPIYPLTRGLLQKPLRRLTRNVVIRMSGEIDDYLPEYLREESRLVSQPEAIRQFHFPETNENLAAARRRLAFDEIFCIQVGLLQRKHERRLADAVRLTVTDTQNRDFLHQLPFSPTRAQGKVMAQVQRDLSQPYPMSRLVQGDVGSGKTVVAAFSIYLAGVSGYQSAFMAPTEILAQQHFESLCGWLGRSGLTVGKLVGSSTAADRRATLAAAESGSVDVLVGTHTLFQEGVDFNRLALAVVDEQHRFGVEQRSRLGRKGLEPHILTMTATPIPRTLALTVYGDLDISIIDELPPGRVPVETQLLASPDRAYRQLGEEIERGRQGFVVCPVIDDSFDSDMNSVLTEHRHLQTEVFPKGRVGLLHGRMLPKDKDRVLGAFRAREYDVLVATSVIEVGIDIPNATVMVVRDADRFGLAQLHQLRGRIGRGAEMSHCLLVSNAAHGPTFERLRAVVRSQDGFELAEEDLRLRGPGEFWGTRQSGIPQLRVAGPEELRLFQTAREAAERMLDRDADLSEPLHGGVRDQVGRFWAHEANFN